MIKLPLTPRHFPKTLSPRNEIVIKISDIPCGALVDKQSPKRFRVRLEWSGRLANLPSAVLLRRCARTAFASGECTQRGTMRRIPRQGAQLGEGEKKRRQRRRLAVVPDDKRRSV